MLKTEIDTIEEETYRKLRDLQYKSKDMTKLADKLVKQKKSILADIIYNLLIMLLPFKKLKTILLLNNFFKGIKSGFTFVELMISLVIISILAAVLYPNLMHFLPNSNKPLFKAAYKTLGNALAEITTEKSNGRLETTTTQIDVITKLSPTKETEKQNATSGQQLCIDFCNKTNIVPEGTNTICGIGNFGVCNDSKLTTTNGMRWLFEDYKEKTKTAGTGYPVLEYHNPAVANKSAFRITVDVNPANSELPSSWNCTIGDDINFGVAGNNNNNGIFCYGNTTNATGVYATDGLPDNNNVNGTFNINNAKAQDTFQFLVDEKGKIISISPVGWAILEDNSQLD